MPLTLTQLRANLYKIVDQIIKTGTPIEVERKGEKIRIIPVKKKKKLDNLIKHPETLLDDPENIVHIDWSKEWKGESHL